MSWMFGQVSPFYGICEQAANFILMNGTYKTIKKGEVLYRAGDYVDGYYAVLEGEVHLQHTDERAIKHSLWPRRKGHWFAYVHHFAGLPAPADAIAYKKNKITTCIDIAVCCIIQELSRALSFRT